MAVAVAVVAAHVALRFRRRGVTVRVRVARVITLSVFTLFLTVRVRVARVITLRLFTLFLPVPVRVRVLGGKAAQRCRLRPRFCQLLRSLFLSRQSRFPPRRSNAAHSAVRPARPSLATHPRFGGVEARFHSRHFFR